MVNNKLKISVSGLKRVLRECQIDRYKRRESLFYEYLSPDYFEFNEVTDESGHKKEGNIWSYGCILSEIFSGIIPWHNKYSLKNELIIIKLLLKKIEFPIPESVYKVDNALGALIKDCTMLEKEKRPTIEDVIKKIDHMINEKNENLLINFCFQE